MKEENCMGAKLSLTGPRRKLTLVFEIQNGRHCLASSARKSSFFFFRLGFPDTPAAHNGW